MPDRPDNSVLPVLQARPEMPDQPEAPVQRVRLGPLESPEAPVQRAQRELSASSSIRSLSQPTKIGPCHRALRPFCCLVSGVAEEEAAEGVAGLPQDLVSPFLRAVVAEAAALKYLASL